MCEEGREGRGWRAKDEGGKGKGRGDLA